MARGHACDRETILAELGDVLVGHHPQHRSVAVLSLGGGWCVQHPKPLFKLLDGLLNDSPIPWAFEFVEDLTKAREYRPQLCGGFQHHGFSFGVRRDASDGPIDVTISHQH
jgi:hypothetical protein